MAALVDAVEASVASPRLMPRLVMVGLSHHAAPLEVRERVVVDEATWRTHAPARHSTLLLSTCNRVEVYAWIDGRTQRAARIMLRSLARAADVPLADIEPYLTVRRGHDALLHLVRVASGLDSLLVGEEQIRGQVRAALRAGEEDDRCRRRCVASSNAPSTLRGGFEARLAWRRRRRSPPPASSSPRRVNTE